MALAGSRGTVGTNDVALKPLEVLHTQNADTQTSQNLLGQPARTANELGTLAGIAKKNSCKLASLKGCNAALARLGSRFPNYVLDHVVCGNRYGNVIDLEC